MSTNISSTLSKINYLAKFKNNLKAIRVKKGISQEKLAEMLDISAKSVVRYECGKAYPTLDILVLMGKKLGVDLVELLTGDYPYSKGKRVPRGRNIIRGARREKAEEQADD